MPPLCHPPPRLGKQPPEVLPRPLAQLADLGDGATWPRGLVIPPGAGLQCVTLASCHGQEAANLGHLGAARE